MQPRAGCHGIRVAISGTVYGSISVNIAITVGLAVGCAGVEGSSRRLRGVRVQRCTAILSRQAGTNRLGLLWCLLNGAGSSGVITSGERALISAEKLQLVSQRGQSQVSPTRGLTSSVSLFTPPFKRFRRRFSIQVSVPTLKSVKLDSDPTIFPRDREEPVVLRLRHRHGRSGGEPIVLE